MQPSSASQAGRHEDGETGQNLATTEKSMDEKKGKSDFNFFRPILHIVIELLEP